MRETERRSSSTSIQYLKLLTSPSSVIDVIRRLFEVEIKATRDEYYVIFCAHDAVCAACFCLNFFCRSEALMSKQTRKKSRCVTKMSVWTDRDSQGVLAQYLAAAEKVLRRRYERRCDCWAQPISQANKGAIAGQFKILPGRFGGEDVSLPWMS